MKGYRQTAGFILVDVLMATVLMAVGLCGVAGVFTQIHRSQHAMDGSEMSSFIAQDTFENIRAHCAENWTSTRLLEKAGTLQLQRGDIVYEKTVTFQVRQDLDAYGRLIEATVRISWETSGNRQERSFLTYYAVETGIGNLR